MTSVLQSARDRATIDPDALACLAHVRKANPADLPLLSGAYCGAASLHASILCETQLASTTAEITTHTKRTYLAFYIKLAKDGLHVYHPSAGTAGSFTMLTIGKTRLHPSIIENFHLTEVAVNIQATNTQFWLRTGETDQKVFEKVFIKNEYEPRQPYTAKAGDEVRTIIDAGANIGCATVWFKSRFPNARIIAIEPDPSNFEQLNRNCGGIPGVELLLGALWGEDTSLDLQFATGRGSLGSWGTRTLPADTSKVAEMRTLAYTVDTLMQKYSLDTIDCLKIDIEGAEKSVFESIHRDWLAKTAVVVAEFHDRFLPGCTAAADAAMADRIQNKYRRGENWFYHIA